MQEYIAINERNQHTKIMIIILETASERGAGHGDPGRIRRDETVKLFSTERTTPHSYLTQDAMHP